MNLAAATETKKREIKYFATTLGPLDSPIVKERSINISKICINRMLHGLEYITPPSVEFFNGKHHEVTNASNVEDQS